MQKYDCTDYENKLCPKGEQIYKNTNAKNSYFLVVGCWGVYCWNGIKDVYSWKEIKNGLDEILQRLLGKDVDIKNLNEEDKLNLIGKYIDDKNVLKLFDKATEIYGQKTVVEHIKKFSNENIVNALFLNGDNVYNYDIPKDKMIKLISDYKNYKNYPKKSKYKNDSTISGQDIKKQLSLGFTECYKNVNIENIFVGLGNHDVQTCEDLNEQLNYDQKNYQLPGTYYNVLYDLNYCKVNFIILDTNLFSEDEHCNNTKVLEKTKRDHIDWFIKTLKDNKANWNIVIGHVPYKANGHKSKEPVIFNNELNKIFEEIKSLNLPKIQLYICADEHNQQYIHDKQNKMGLVIAGSGGTALDKDIQRPDIYKNDTLYVNNSFGFISLKFEKDNIKVSYYTSEIDTSNSEETFNVNINLDGDLTNS